MDVGSRKGGLLVYIKSSLPSKMLTKFKLSDNIEIIPFVQDLRKEKRLFGSIYKPPLQNNQYFVSILSDLLNFYSDEYDNRVVLGDFNLEPSSPSMLFFMDSQNFVNLIKNKTCFKGASSCPDLILTNRKYSFKNTSSYKTMETKRIITQNLRKVLWKHLVSMFRRKSKFFEGIISPTLKKHREKLL